MERGGEPRPPSSLYHTSPAPAPAPSPPRPLPPPRAPSPPPPSRQVGEEHVGGLVSHPSEGEEAAFTDAHTTTDGFADAPLTDAFGGASAMHAFGEAPAANGSLSPSSRAWRAFATRSRR